MMPEKSITTGFVYSMGIVYGVIVLGAFARIMPLSALIALLTIPIALKVRRLIKGSLGNPYALIPAMFLTVKLYVSMATLLVVGYLVSFLIHF